MLLMVVLLFYKEVLYLSTPISTVLLFYMEVLYLSKPAKFKFCSPTRYHVHAARLWHPRWYVSTADCVPVPKRGIQPFESGLDQFWFLRKVHKQVQTPNPQNLNSARYLGSTKFSYSCSL